MQLWFVTFVLTLQSLQLAITHIHHHGEMSGITPPSMNWDTKDPPSAFKSFRQYCELIFKGPLNKSQMKKKFTYTLLWLGQEGIQIFKSWGKENCVPSDFFFAYYTLSEALCVLSLTLGSFRNGNADVGLCVSCANFGSWHSSSLKPCVPSNPVQ